MESFVYTGLPARVLFGRGTTERSAAEAHRLGMRRALVLSTPAQEAAGRAVAERLGECAAGLFAGAAMHTPVEITERALAAWREAGADGVVAIGGGSTIGLGKAIALRTGCPQIVLPTTYAGSEMTPILGQTEGGRKTTRRTMDVLPETVIYDVEHTLGLPWAMTLTSGLNAVAHAVEALYAEGANPVLSLMAEEGVARMVGALGRLRADPMQPEARADALQGAWLCATCLGSGGIALHHKLCHVLGGTFDLPHAQTHAAVLPHALAYNASAVPEAMERLARATSSSDPAGWLWELGSEGGTAMALRDLGMPEEGIERAVEITLESPYPNPRPLERDMLLTLLRAAWRGERPAP